MSLVKEVFSLWFKMLGMERGKILCEVVKIIWSRVKDLVIVEVMDIGRMIELVNI